MRYCNNPHKNSQAVKNSAAFKSLIEKSYEIKVGRQGNGCNDANANKF